MQRIHEIQLAGSGASIMCPEGEPILLAALKAGKALAYECGSGTCGSCYAELREGTVHDRWPEAPGLTAQQRAKRRVLLCQTEPRSNCTIGERLQSLPREGVPATVTTTAEVVAVEAACRNTARVIVAPEAPMRFMPGQYALFELAGISGLRAYSMANRPDSCGRRLEFYVKVAGRGTMSSRLVDPALVGSRVTLHGPLGHAFLRSEASEDVILVAGGSGLAPILSIARALVETEEDGRRIALYFGIRSRDDLFGLAEIERIRCAAPARFRATIALSDENPAGEEVEIGQLHEVIERKEHDWTACRVYMAGPLAMINAMLRVLTAKKVQSSRVHFDRFG